MLPRFTNPGKFYSSFWVMSSMVQPRYNYAVTGIKLPGATIQLISPGVVFLAAKALDPWNSPCGKMPVLGGE